MRVLACYNMKGGVGKTTTSVNLAFTSALEGARTLLWDLDPQGAASFHFDVKPLELTKLKKLIKDKKHLQQWVQPSGYRNLDIIPAGFEIRHLDMVLGDDIKKSKKKLGKLVHDLGAEYDVFLLDCPPSISALSEAIFGAADCILMPLIPTVLSEQTYIQVKQYLNETSGNADCLTAFFNMVDRRKSLQRTTVLRASRNPDFCESSIPNRARIEQMGVQKAPVGAFAPGSDEQAAYRALWKELQRRLGV